MGFILVITGLLLFVTAYNGTTGRFAGMLKDDVFGNGGFIYWALAIILIGAIGYIKPLKGLSDAFIGLLLLVLFLHDKGGFFSQFNQAIASTPSKVTTSTSYGLG